MRCYHFTNFYLSQIQHGIQSAHAQMNLFTKYQQESDLKRQLYDWAVNYKTMICLNAGCNSDLLTIFNTLQDKKINYPWADFWEEPGSVSHVSTLTNVAIVLPAAIYASELTNEEVDQALSDPHWNGGILSSDLILIQMIRRCRLA